MAEKTPKISRSEFVRGMSVKSILSMTNEQFNKLTEPQLRHIVTRLASAGNKRLRKFEEKGEKSPAYSRAVKNGFFTAKNKSLSQLRHEFLREKEFLQNKYSTVSKWLPLKQKLIKGMQASGIGIDHTNFYDIFDVYQKLREVDQSVTYGEFKYTALKEIEEFLESPESTNQELEEMEPGERAKAYALELNNRLSEIIGEQEEMKQKADSTSDFFNMGGWKS